MGIYQQPTNQKKSSNNNKDCIFFFVAEHSIEQVECIPGRPWLREWDRPAGRAQEQHGWRRPCDARTNPNPSPPPPPGRRRRCGRRTPPWRSWAPSSVSGGLRALWAWAHICLAARPNLFVAPIKLFDQWIKARIEVWLELY